MKKVVFVLFVILTVDLMYANGSLETDKFSVQMDVSCTDPELIVSPNGDMYFFYIKDSKLLIEKKGKDDIEFQFVKNTFTDPAMNVKSIKRFSYLNNSQCLVITFNEGISDSLYLLRIVNDSIVLDLEQRLDNHEDGIINNVKLITLSQEKFITTYVKNDHLYYSIITSDTANYMKLTENKIKKYDAYFTFYDNEPSVGGYILNENNSLSCFMFNETSNDIMHLADYKTYDTIRIDYEWFEDIFYCFVYIDDEIIDRYNLSDNTFERFISPYGNKGKYYINSYTVKPDFVLFENNNLFLNNLFITKNVKEYKYLKNYIYFLKDDGSIYLYNINNDTVLQLTNNSYKQIYLFNDINSIFLYPCELNSNTVSTFSVTSGNEYINYEYTLDNYLNHKAVVKDYNNLFLFQRNDSLYYYDESRTIKRYDILSLILKKNELRFERNMGFLNINGKHYMLEVSK